MPKKITQEEFKTQLSIEHPNIELLSEYKGNKEYITVRCKKHNYTFKTKPNWLHAGHGCKKCYDEKRGSETKKSLENFITQAKVMHGDKYDYSKVEYKNNKTKVCIICPIHGEFWQRPDKHIGRGDGCPHCAKIDNGIKKRLKYGKFIERALKIHRGYYKYDKNTYTTSENKIKIICPEHGEFWQSPYYHTLGCGCPKCNSSHLERSMMINFQELQQCFDYQKKFEWLGMQSLDFYLEDKNIAIECQGKQHFYPIEHFGGEKGYKLILQRDKRKKQLLEEHNIQLIYVIDNDVDIEFLNKELYTKDNTFTINNITQIIKKI